MILNDISALFTNLKKNPKQMMIVLSVAAGLTLLVYLNFLLMPQIVNVSATRSKFIKVKTDLRDAKSDIARIGSMKGIVESYNKKVSQYEKTLPTEEGIPGLLENLSEMAKGANMRISGIIPTDQREAKTGSSVYKEIPIMVSAKAGYHELGQFLSNLENSGRFMKVADIQIRADRTLLRKHDVELLVVTYVLLEGR